MKLPIFLLVVGWLVGSETDHLLAGWLFHVGKPPRTKRRGGLTMFGSSPYPLDGK